MFDQRGEGRLGLFIWLIVIAAGIFVAVKCVPTRINVMQLHDFASAEVQYAAASNRIKPEKIIERILEKAEELEVPLDKSQIKLDVRPQEVMLSMKHDVTIDLKVYQWKWEYSERFTHLRM